MNNVSKFGENLKEILFDNGNSVKEVCENTGFSTSQFYRWQKNSSVPSFKHLVVLSKYFNCSVDCLLGREDTFQDCVYKTEFSARLIYLIEKKGVKFHKVYRDLNISSFVFYNWLKGRYKPLLDNLLKLANYFDCSIDYLIGIEL